MGERINFRKWSEELTEVLRGVPERPLEQADYLRAALKTAYNAGLDRAAEECDECREAIQAAMLAMPTGSEAK